MLRRVLASSFILTAGCFEDVAPMEMTSGGTSTNATTSATAPPTASGTAPNSNTDGNTTVDPTETDGASTTGVDTVDPITTGADSSSTGTGSDSSTGDTPLPTVCPIFVDDFEDGREDPVWMQEPNSASVEAGGEWTINVSAEGEDVFARMRLPAVNFEGATARFEIGTPPADDDVLLILWLQQQGEQEGRIAFNLIQTAGQLQLQARVTSKAGPPGVVVDLAPWQPETQRWMQLREEGGSLYFEASQDGTTFQQVFTVPVPISLDAVTVGFVGHNRTQLPEDVEVSIRHFELECGGL